METSYNTEFPDFGELPALVSERLASGQLVDQSWHNDVCPSFSTVRGDKVISAAGDFENVPVLWVDYADPAFREMGPETSHFLVAFKGEATPFENESEALARMDALESTL